MWDNFSYYFKEIDLRMFLLFSHKLTQIQIDDAKESLGVDEFIYLPNELQELFSQIPADLKEIQSYLEPIDMFLIDRAKKGDYVLIQGDFGAVWHFVKTAMELELIPIYSTNKRVAQERFEGDKFIKVSEFEHILFREYR
jgi:hypothetical protein